MQPKLFAQFGGQGSGWLEELRSLNFSHAHAPGSTLTKKIIACALDALKGELAEASSLGLDHLMPLGLDVSDWINAESNAPPSEYLSRAPISYPCIGLTQMSQYSSTWTNLAAKGGDMISMLSGATGHSQGLAAAVVVAMSQTEEQLVENTVIIVRYLFWHGLRMQQVSQRLDITGSPMLTIKAPSSSVVEALLATANAKFNQEALPPLRLSLINAHNTFVVSGHPKQLAVLNDMLLRAAADPSETTAKVLFSARKPSMFANYLDTSAPFHSDLLKEAECLVMQDLKRLGLSISRDQLLVPVFSSFDGSDLSKGDGDLLAEMVSLQTTRPVNWPACISPMVIAGSPGFVLDFGPGAERGAATLSARALQGTSTAVVVATTLQNPTGKLVDLAQILHEHRERSGESCTPATLPGILLSAASSSVRSWEAEFALRLEHGTVQSRFTMLTGRPPIMVAGMTPTTSEKGIRLVAAVAKAGYLCELAAGGLSRPAMFERAIQELMAASSPGTPIHLNLLYLNAKQWRFQFPLLLSLRKSGAPIESITIAAGIPSAEKAADILDQAQAAGLRFVSFKPGSANAIRSVVALARLRPSMPIVIQWTGGRGGGHHSTEDFHEPLLETYALIRRQPNVVLVVGSGFGDAVGIQPYLTG
jgi:malonyl CoA-acyl carrier protein transacylase